MKKYLFIAAAVAIGVGASVAYAAVPDGNGVIHACYRTSSGDIGRLRIIDQAKHQACKSYCPISPGTTQVRGAFRVRGV